MKASIIIIDFEEQLEYLTSVQIMVQQLTLLSMYDGNHLIGLLSSRDVNGLAHHLIAKLPHVLLVACGNPSPRVEGAAQSFEQAHRMLSLKKRFSAELNDSLFYYEAGALRYIQPYEEKTILVSDHPALAKLDRYDKLNQASLLATLEMYIKNDGHLALTAKALHIHANSLQYRLKRITEITGLHLKDSSERIGLYLDFMRRH